MRLSSLAFLPPNLSRLLIRYLYVCPRGWERQLGLFWLGQQILFGGRTVCVNWLVAVCAKLAFWPPLASMRLTIMLTVLQMITYMPYGLLKACHGSKPSR